MATFDNQDSFLRKFLSQPRPTWVTFVISAVLLLVPFLAAQLDGLGAELIRTGSWRPLLIGPVIIIYILIVSPILARDDSEALRAFRPIVQLDDQAFSQVVERAGYIKPLYEILILALGAAFGAWLGSTWLRDSPSAWLYLCNIVLMAVMFGLLAVVVYWSIQETRVMVALHQQPLQFDLFDLSPFEPIGRQSLGIALTFVGGITLSLLLSVDPQNLFAWQNGIVYVPLVLVPVVVFFLNMRDTHRVLAQAKKSETEIVERRLARAARGLTGQIAASESAVALAAELNALAAYQKFLRNARTWPYNTAMLRTLFVSVLIPGTIALAGRVMEGFFNP